MNTPVQIKEYQRNCHKRYKEEISYPIAYNYLYGNPINVQVPIETAVGRYMIIGAYPLAKFYIIDHYINKSLT